MDFMGIPLFNVMKAKLNYISARQSVLAQNIANADTPDYQAKDIKEPDFKTLARTMQTGAAQNLPLTITDAKHVMGSGKMGASYAAGKRPTTYERNPNGNNVVIEEEMMRVSENQAEYQKVLSLYTKTISMFKTAIGKQGA